MVSSSVRRKRRRQTWSFLGNQLVQSLPPLPVCELSGERGCSPYTLRYGASTMGLPLAVVVLLAAVLLLSEYAVGQSGRVVFEDDDNDKCPGHEPHCVYLQECPQALQQVRSGHHPKICDWVNKTTALICCATPTVYPVDETPFPPDIVPATDTKVVNPDTPVPPVTEPLPPVTEPLPPVVTEPPNIPTDDLDDCECEDPLPPSPATDGRNPSTVVRVPGEPTASTASTSNHV